MTNVNKCVELKTPSVISRVVGL